jgi:hypothetical protein
MKRKLLNPDLRAPLTQDEFRPVPLSLILFPPGVGYPVLDLVDDSERSAAADLNRTVGLPIIAVHLSVLPSFIKAGPLNATRPELS